MKLFPWKKNKPLFSEEENHLVVKAIRQAEKRTSGEVRVYVENRCRFMDAIDRAAEIFFSLKMEQTEERNAVLVYVALKDHQLAVFADEGIYKRTGQDYWNKVVSEMIATFNQQDYAKGIAECVIQIGDALHTHFPYDGDTDKNELPDQIVFGN
ncbi:MAG: TPM domain-containing protein [Sphingobacteriales bacterium]|nr:TPM domain-containing protein [Sphingobacteriales bacterium]